MALVWKMIFGLVATFVIAYLTSILIGEIRLWLTRRRLAKEQLESENIETTAVVEDLKKHNDTKRKQLLKGKK